MSTQDLQKPLFTLHDVASLLACSVRTIRRSIDERKIKAVRIRHRWMICREDLEAYIAKQPTNLR